MGLKLITPPADPVLTLTEARDHLRVVDTNEDTLIAALVTAASRNVENWTGRALIDQTWELYVDTFPTGTALEIKIPKPPLIEVTQFAYDDESGVQQILDPADYYVDNITQPGWVVPVGTTPTWPTAIDAINSVRIKFRAGYLSTDVSPVNDVPEDIKSAVRLLVGSMYEHREEQIAGTVAYKMPWGIEQLLRPYRVLLGMA